GAGSQADDAAKTRRNAQRTAETGTICEPNFVCCQRGRGTSGRAAGGARVVPGIARDPPDRVERMAARKLRDVRLCQWNGAVRTQRGDRPVVVSRAMLRKDWRAVGGELASHIIVILDCDREAGEPARVLGRLAAEGLCPGTGLVEETDRQGVDAGLHGSYARGGSLHHLQWRHLGCAKLADGFGCRKLPELAHLLFPSAYSCPIPSSNLSLHHRARSSGVARQCAA